MLGLGLFIWVFWVGVILGVVDDCLWVWLFDCAFWVAWLEVWRNLVLKFGCFGPSFMFDLEVV